MLFAPPTHSHEERLTRPRVCSPPIQNRNNSSANRNLSTLSLSPPQIGRSPTSQSRELVSCLSPPTGRFLQMSNLNEYPQSSSTSGHTAIPRRSPQTTPTQSSASSAVGLLGTPISLSVPGSSSGLVGSPSSSLSSVPVGGGSTPPLHHPLLGYVPHGNKILSRNLNGTLALTPQPNNESELQLYRVLQRANLLSYYDTFITQGRVQGGDDVQQLCEAGEEEFLEIMALVGMASKPLHVRRLQKALQEWVSNPSVFQIPLLPNLPPSVVAGFPSFGSRSLLGSSTPTLNTRPSPPISSSMTPSLVPNHISSPGLGKDAHSSTNNRASSPRDGLQTSSTTVGTPSAIGSGSHVESRGCSPSLPMGPYNSASHSQKSLPLQNCQTSLMPDKGQELFLQFMKNSGCESPGLSYPPCCGSPLGGSPGNNSPQGMTPTLHEAQIARLAQSASELVANLPPLESRKDQLSKRKMSKEFEMIMNMSDDDPRRMEEMRKYAAIYGRFDCKRKPEKPLTMHEVSVNEAAAQICKYMPALLTRRDELFPLARQVVRDSGYQYSKGHSRSQTIIAREDEPRHKRTRTDSGPDYEKEYQWKKRQERLESISEELRAMSDRAEEVRNSLTSGTGNLTDLTQQMDGLQTRHAQLTLEQNELLKAHQKSFFPRSRSERSCSEDPKDDSDSQFSYSANNSPSQVISSSQGNIIAVANPALSLSSTITASHSLHEDPHLASIYSTNKHSIKQEPGSPNKIE